MMNERKQVIDQRAGRVAHCTECGSEDVRYVTGAEFAWWQKAWRVLRDLRRPGLACMAWCPAHYATDAHRWPHTMLWRLPEGPGRTWCELDVITGENDPEQVTSAVHDAVTTGATPGHPAAVSETAEQRAARLWVAVRVGTTCDAHPGLHAVGVGLLRGLSVPLCGTCLELDGTPLPPPDGDGVTGVNR